MTDYKPGDRVRVTLEGFVTAGPGSHGEYRVSEDGKPYTDRVAWAWVSPEHMERLPDPEPDWQPGDVITTPLIGSPGHTLLRTADGQWRCTCALTVGAEPAEWVTARWHAGKVTPLVRGGKPWGET